MRSTQMSPHRRKRHETICETRRFNCHRFNGGRPDLCTVSRGRSPRGLLERTGKPGRYLARGHPGKHGRRRKGRVSRTGPTEPPSRRRSRRSRRLVSVRKMRPSSSVRRRARSARSTSPRSADPLRAGGRAQARCALITCTRLNCHRSKSLNPIPLGTAKAAVLPNCGPGSSGEPCSCAGLESSA